MDCAGIGMPITHATAIRDDMIRVSRMNNVIPIAVKNDGRNKRLLVFDSTRRGSAFVDEGLNPFNSCPVDGCNIDGY
jgi:hypothetical protein